MLKYFPARCEKKHAVLRTELLQKVTRDVGEGVDISERVVAHYIALARFLQEGGYNPSNNGNAFEIVLRDAFLYFGLNPDAITEHIDPTGSGGTAGRRNADADTVVGEKWSAVGRVAVLKKSSLRERWKQADRDADIFIKCGYTAVWLVTFSEQPVGRPPAGRHHRVIATTPIAAIAFVNYRQKQCVSRLRLVTAYDLDGMSELLRCLKDAASHLQFIPGKEVGLTPNSSLKSQGSMFEMEP